MRTLAWLVILTVIGVMIACAIAVYRGAPPWIAGGILLAPVAGCPVIFWAYERRGVAPRD